MSERPESSKGLPARFSFRQRLHPVWWLNAVIVAACGVMVSSVVWGGGAFSSGRDPWWSLALAIAVTERWPLHFEFRSSSYSHTLTDVPVTLALIFLGGPAAVVAVIAGAVPAMLARRLSPIRIVFNASQSVLAVCVGYGAAHLLAGQDEAFGPLVWLGTFVGVQLGGLVTVALVGAAISLAEGGPRRPFVRRMIGLDALVTATNASFGLVLAVVLQREPLATPIFLLPIATVVFAYRAYVIERERHEKLEFLYEANRSLSNSTEVAEALEGLLQRALEAYRAEHAEVILLPPDGHPLRTSLSAGEVGERLAPVVPTEAYALRRALEEAGGPVILCEPFPAEIQPHLAARRIRHAMIAELRSEERVAGVLLIANRVGMGRTFTDDDLVLFETLAANASSALQFDRLEQSLSELRGLQDQLRHQAYHDPLTGLANRALFGQEVRAALATPASAEGVAVLFIDLDDFKAVNDTLGHHVGDELLRAAAVRLASCVREDDLVARFGGDEFALLLRGRNRAEEAGIDVARRVLTAFREPVEVGGEQMHVALSVGVATSEHSGDHVDDLLRDADVAMYEAKDGGKARMAVFDPVMRQAMMRRHGVREELARAISGGDLVVQYQPIVDLDTDRTWSMEALVRWKHAWRGRVPPGEFIPLAEETGLIVPLGRFVLETACHEAAQWRGSDDLPAPAVQVNLSALELEDDGLVDAVSHAIASSGIEPGRLVLEITETLLMQDAERAVARLTALRALGVKLALDDFGTGYSSLSYLRTLPLDMVKIAKPFVDAIAVDERDQAFVRLMVDLAKTIGLSVVAEGVETIDQLQALRAVGCELGQGYLFAAAVDDVQPWVGSIVPNAA